MTIFDIIEKSLHERTLVSITLSGSRDKNLNYNRIDIRPIIIGDTYMLQFVKNIDNKDIHENLQVDIAYKLVRDLLENIFRNFNVLTTEKLMQGMVSKKRKITFKASELDKEIDLNLSHNRKKEYIIPDNKPCDFLHHLGVMDANGKVYKSKYDKFRQINKFLEIMDHVVSSEAIGDRMRIVDFGCGKAYLTFAVYYYFKEVQKKNVFITGLDLKEDVVEFCNTTAVALGYENLVFRREDIRDYSTKDTVDMVITLHACDTATDAALVKAIKWQAKYILSVPCCQHEMFDKIQNKNLQPMLDQGLIKERMSSLVTDTLRVLFLQKEGYDVSTLEFISMEHTPKNLMLRRVKKNMEQKKYIKQYEDFKNFWNLGDIFIEEFYEREMKNDES
ncbi:MAG: SAM-dependent methyltransferase [Dethiosulfatibacter sp.]|nr:SAM-dependent methyltransferase [Dethiosulfatibacter sp.]